MKFFVSILLIGLIFPLFCQDRIEERVEVEWWVFLLFDLSLSSRNTIFRSKATAKQIVSRADPNQHFIIMSITPTQGMCFNGGPLNDKSRVLEILERVVKPHGRSGNFSIPEQLNNIANETDLGKYTPLK